MTVRDRRPHSGEVFIVLVSVLLIGCGQESDRTQPLSGADEIETVRRMEAAEAMPTEEMVHVEPGTKLTEALFLQTLRETRAKFIVVQVYIEACGPCMTEALRLTEKQKVWRESGVAVMGLGMDDTPDGPQAFYRHTSERITFPLYMAPWFAEQQEVLATPTIFLYAADGEQLFRIDPEAAEEGVLPALDAKLSTLLSTVYTDERLHQ